MKYTKLTILSISSLVMMGCNEVPQLPRPMVVQSQSDFIDTNLTQPMDTNLSKPIDTNQTIPKPPKKHIKLKMVEDDNFSPDYMYPETKKLKSPKPTTLVKKDVPSVSVMNKDECISLIGQERFDKYAQMFGGDSGAIKRCKMIKASQS